MALDYILKVDEQIKPLNGKYCDSLITSTLKMEELKWGLEKKVNPAYEIPTNVESRIRQ